jgi:peptidylprolyl isomerase
MFIKKVFTILAMATALTACGASSAEKQAVDADSVKNEQTKKEDMQVLPDRFVEIKTSMGDITVRLYGDTPKHQANFMKLVKDCFYDSLLFHRVINDFMVQAGDPESRNAAPGKMLGNGDVGYEIDAEFLYPKHFHKRGALAAARTPDNVNPEKKSSGCQFYIVTGRKVSAAQMQQIEQQYSFREKQDEFNRLAMEHMSEIRAMQQSNDTQGLKTLQQQIIDQVEAKFAGKPAAKLPEEIAQAYTTEGGTPHLDGSYTVFGEVIKGMEVVDKIQKVATDSNDRPKEDVLILSMKEVKN